MGWIKVRSKKMTIIISEPLKEALKEVGRLVLLAIIPLLIIQLESGMFDYKSILVVIIVTILRFIDKYIHEIGKDRGQESLIKGLTRF